MNLKKKLLIAVAVILSIAFISGITLLAATNFGSQNDPLVTLSYLNNILKPQILEAVDTAIADAKTSLAEQFDERIESFKAEMAEILENAEGANVEVFRVVNFSNGQTLTCAAGTEVMLREGTAETAGGAAAFTDTMGGAALDSGDELVSNHIYMATGDGSQIKPTADSVKIMIRGNYSID